MEEMTLTNIVQTMVALFFIGLLIYGVWRYNKINKEIDIGGL